jgi:hypothetical protein
MSSSEESAHSSRRDVAVILSEAKNLSCAWPLMSSSEESARCSRRDVAVILSEAKNLSYAFARFVGLTGAEA